MVPATVQEQPCRCRGKDLRNSREREESRHLPFSLYGITSRSKPFHSCHCVTLPEQTHLGLHLLSWVLAWLLISGKKCGCLGEKSLFLSYLSCCGRFFLCSEIKLPCRMSFWSASLFPCLATLGPFKKHFLASLC